VLQSNNDYGFVAKVSDFGMSEMFISGGPLLGEIGGTVTHIAPEMVTSKQVRRDSSTLESVMMCVATAL
jgi:hypothetical protein